MTYGENLWLFFLLLTGIIVVPGMDMMFVLANALTRGRAAGLAATLGLMVGGACHTLFGTVAVAGLSRLMPAVYGPMLMIGSAYMMWIGITLMKSSIVVDTVGGAAVSRGVLVQGIVTCLLNPKAWLFILAVYPQFMTPAYGPLGPQALVMGTMTVSVQFAVYGALAVAAARGRDALVANPALTIRVGRVAGLLLVAIAGYTLLRGFNAL
ncbi:LysE family translocator [Pleomorphomonas carboxyditropha]|uniref:Threonine transporter RhtB n=1 Tax=Pleomorphomonas carboxyditropha TaxID=2023338 RepID=A0A2G9WRL4_9HYPH|nr:LysE family translocator [Pleomorphomonas carboxyditropha]PIO97295.1 threonine transporter RhtB [Pleomorphomonas carboxyditropha]